MSDTTQTIPVQPAPTQPSDLQPLAADVQELATVITAAIAAYKTKGTTGLTDLAPRIVDDVKKDYQDVAAAMPVIKAGYKTTEFWLIAALLAGNGVYAGITGKVLPIDVNATIASLLGIYTVCRQILKK